ncbi:MAG: hypothetical protein IPJ03_04500 [Ignavibacteriales bacterium]|nr:hypothetical protein [Ignavibacteriales bacterium]
MNLKFKNIAHLANKVIVFFNLSKANYWHTVTVCNIEKKVETLGKYYLDFSSKIFYPLSFDANGVPLYQIDREKYFYHPIVIAQYALGVYENMIRGKINDKELLLKYLTQADWFVHNAVKVNSWYSWQLQFDLKDYGLYSPWYSAMAQGEAISVLTRAYSLTGEKKYLDLCEQSIGAFFVKVKDGGFLNYFQDFRIYEEYPSPIKTNGVLNGFIFSLFGLYDLYLVNKNSLAFQLFTDGIHSLKNLIKFYDSGHWSRYYLFDYPKVYHSSFTYHEIVINQLKALYFLTNEDIFLSYSMKWAKYRDSIPNRTRALLSKLFYARTLS